MVVQGRYDRRPAGKAQYTCNMLNICSSATCYQWQTKEPWVGIKRSLAQLEKHRDLKQ